MAYMIDGHNLIGQMKGLSLRDMDDEMALVSILQVFCRVKRRKVEVYFDGAPPGFARSKRFGQVTAHFVQERIQADDAMIRRLQNMGRIARNWTVVSSDRKIQAQARSVHARVLSSQEFGDEVVEAQRLALDTPADDTRSAMSSQEIDYWLGVFQDKKGGKGKPENS